MIDDLMWRHLDRNAVASLQQFYHKVNERSEFQAGLRASYEAPNDALGPEVEYFHPVITYDDRMRYICENIADNQDFSPRNRLGNVIISHFYGARGIHQVLTNEKNPKRALVDFEQLWVDRESKFDSTPGQYTSDMRAWSVEQKRKKVPFWGTTELHSSIQTAANRYVKESWGPEGVTPFAVCEWIASWIGDGTMDAMLASGNFYELYSHFKKIPGIGSYYAYHGAAGVSNMPAVRAYHGEFFCDPGPGARETAIRLFPDLSKKEVPLDQRVIWLTKNQGEVMELPKIHESRHNIVVNGKPIYPEPQDSLKTYGTEVCMCQFSVYTRLSENPELISRRRVARVEAEQQCEIKSDLENFFHD